MEKQFDNDALNGAGTVMAPTQTDDIDRAGGRLVVMPHADPDIVRAPHAAGFACVPGIATPTEHSAALAAGADGLKVVPADTFPPAALKAW